MRLTLKKKRLIAWALEIAVRDRLCYADAYAKSGGPLDDEEILEKKRIIKESKREAEAFMKLRDEMDVEIARCSQEKTREEL